MTTVASKLLLLGAVGLTACSSSDKSVFASDDSAPDKFTVGGVVSGLTSAGLVLQNNGTDDLPVPIPGEFTFPTPLASGSTYSVTVKSQPGIGPAQSCSVTHGSGTVGNADVTSVEISCTTQVGRFLYVANLDSNDVSGYTIDARNGQLTAIAGSPFPADRSPVFVSADRNGRTLYVANKGSPTTTPRLSTYSIDPPTGALAQAPHSPFDITNTTPASGALDLGKPLVHRTGTFVYIGATAGQLDGGTIDDLGDLTQIPGMPVTAGVGLAFGTLNAAGTVLYVPHDAFSGMAAGGISAYSIHTPSGVLTFLGAYSTGGRVPTMAVLQRSGGFLLAPNSNFGNARGSVAVFAVDAVNGTLTAVAGSPFATGVGTIPVSVAVHPFKSFVYTTNSNGSDASDITAFAMDAGTGFLAPVLGSPFASNGGAATPGSIDPSGRFFFVANQRSNSIQGFSIDQDTGALTKVPGSPFPAGLAPTAVSIDVSGRFLYCSNSASDTVSAYAIDSTTGALTRINTVATGRSPGVVEQVGLQ